MIVKDKSMKIKRGYLKELANIDEQFFEIDKAKGTVKVELRFDSPDDIFDLNYVSKIPVLSDDFLDLIRNVFTLVSSKYKIDLTVKLDDMKGYDGDTLEDIFKKNLTLEFSSKLVETRMKKRVAYGMIGLGVGMFFATVLIGNVWQSDSVWKDIIIYLSDIAATVAFWEALSILVIERSENRSYLIDLASRFSSIRFIEE